MIPITKVDDRIGTPYVEIDAKKIVGVVECNIPDEARAFKDLDPITTQIGNNVAEFLAADMKRGIIPPTFLPLQSGVGTTANAILAALSMDKNIPDFNILAILGTTAVICPLEIQGITPIDLIVMGSSVFLLWLFSFTKLTVARWEGAVLTSLFAIYMIYLLSNI